MENQSPQASPKAWDGAFAAIGYGVDRIKQDPAFFILYLVLSLVGALFTKANPESSFGGLLTFIMSLVFLVAYSRYCLNQSAGQASPIADTFKTNSQEYFRLLGVVLLAAALAMASVFTLFIGLIWVLPWVAFMTYVVLNEQVGVMEAFRRSRQLAKGNMSKVWALIGAAILFGILAGVLNIFPVIGWLASQVALTVITTAAGIGVAKLYRSLKA